MKNRPMDWMVTMACLILDEAKWGMEWLLKMHPKECWMFNQIADDRDHIGMRMPKQDSLYGRGYQRPFIL